MRIGSNIWSVGKGSVFAALLLVFTALPLLAFGASLDLGEVTGCPGEDVTIPISLTTEGAQISAIAFDIGFDPDILENPKVAIGAAGSATGKDLVSNEVGPGLLRVGILSIQNNDPIGDGILAYFSIRIKDSATPDTDTIITISPSASDPIGNPIPIVGGVWVIHIVECNPARLDLGSGSAPPGGCATLPMTLTTDGSSIYSISADLSYDPNLITYHSITIGPAGVAAGVEPVSSEVSPGLVRVGFLSFQPIGDGILGYITFCIASVDCGTIITISNDQGSDGEITVLCEPQINTSHPLPSILPDANALAGVTYQCQVEATGGSSPYGWSITGIPDGLGINVQTGLLSGKPLECGTSVTSVTITDNNLMKDTKDFPLKVSLLGDSDDDCTVAINELQIAINGYLGIYLPREQEFCGFSTYGPCQSDLDCMRGGCSSEACQSTLEEPIATICLWLDCYDSRKYGVSCRCVHNRCQWTK